MESIGKAIYQLIAANGAIEHSDLLSAIDFIKPDFTDTEKELHQIFREINLSMAKLSLEVRGVSYNVGEERQVFYAIVNTEDDPVAKDHASMFSPVELDFYSKLALELLAKNKLSSNDIKGKFFPDKMKNSHKFEYLMQRLQEYGWLSRNEENYWIIGVRAYIELDGYLRQLIHQQYSDNDAEQAGSTSNSSNQSNDESRLLSKLPQVLLY